MLRALWPQEIGARDETGTTLLALSVKRSEGTPMKRNRRNTLLWMKDLLDHMSRCHDQLEWASDGDTQSFLADALIGDLNECQKLCEQLRAAQGHDRRARTLVPT
jgi:hypothetical protein